MEIAQKRRERVTRACLYHITYEKLCWIFYIQIFIILDISYIKLKYMYIVYVYQYLYIIYAYNTMFYKYKTVDGVEDNSK